MRNTENDLEIKKLILIAKIKEAIKKKEIEEYRMIIKRLQEIEAAKKGENNE